MRKPFSSFNIHSVAVCRMHSLYKNVINKYLAKQKLMYSSYCLFLAKHLQMHKLYQQSIYWWHSMLKTLTQISECPETYWLNTHSTASEHSWSERALNVPCRKTAQIIEDPDTNLLFTQSDQRHHDEGATVMDSITHYFEKMSWIIELLVTNWLNVSSWAHKQL